jgi:hypothetical protein
MVWKRSPRQRRISATTRSPPAGFDVSKASRPSSLSNSTQWEKASTIATPSAMVDSW